MTDIREYLQKKEKKDKNKNEDFKKQIRTHRVRMLVRTTCVTVILAALLGAAYVQLKNQTYSSYMVVTETTRKHTKGTSLLAYQDGFVTYSKDGISYTDYKGNAMWNQTYEMQSPRVSVRGKWVAAGDFNGHTIYDINQDGTVQEIDTNLPIRGLTVSANGVVAAILEDGGVTWINVYNPSGEKAVGIKTTMQKSGYPMAISLSDNGKLMQVSYLKVESGSMKSIISFYNFDEVGQNYTDTMVSSYEYPGSVVPFVAFMNESTAFSVADNQLMIYEGAEIPKNILQNFVNEQIRDVYYGGNYIGLVFDGTNGEGKYRLDVYDKAGNKVVSKPFQLEYRDIIFTKDTMIIYNEAECLISRMNGKDKYAGEISPQTQLLKPLGGNRFLAVTLDTLDIVEMK